LKYSTNNPEKLIQNQEFFTIGQFENTNPEKINNQRLK